MLYSQIITGRWRCKCMLYRREWHFFLKGGNELYPRYAYLLRENREIWFVNTTVNQPNWMEMSVIKPPADLIEYCNKLKASGEIRPNR